MCRALLVTALTLAAACGGSPTTPSTNTPQSISSLASGAYRLTVSMSTSGDSGFSACVSLTIGGEAPPAFASVSVPTTVQLDHSGDTITVTPDDPAATFRMQLQQAGAGLSGTASGKFQSSATTVTVGGTSQNAPAAATGVIEPSGAIGRLNGSVSVNPGMGCTNNAHGWTLMPR